MLQFVGRLILCCFALGQLAAQPGSSGQSGSLVESQKIRWPQYLQETGLSMPSVPPREPGVLWRCTYSSGNMQRPVVRYFWYSYTEWMNKYPTDHPIRSVPVGPQSVTCPETLGAANTGPTIQGIMCNDGLRTDLQNVGYHNRGASTIEPYDARDGLVGRTLIYNPFYISPGVLLKRQFTETQLIESIGPITRTHEIEYAGNYWCRSVKGARKCFAIATENNTGADYIEVEVRPDTAPRAICKFQLHGAMQIVTGKPAPTSDLSANARRRKVRSERPAIPEVFGKWGVPNSKVIPAEDTKLIAEFWDRVDTTPRLRENDPVVQQPTALDLLVLWGTAKVIWSLFGLESTGNSAGNEARSCTLTCKSWTGTTLEGNLCKYPLCASGQTMYCGSSVVASCE